MLQRGSGLLEFLLVLSIASVVLLGGFQLQQRYQLQRQTTGMQQYLEHIMLASVAYFYQQCTQQRFDQTNLTLDELVQAGALDKRYQDYNPWGSDFDIVINNSEPDRPAQITLSLDMNALPDRKSDVYYHQLFSAKGSGVNFIWQFNPQTLLSTIQGDSPQLQWQLAPVGVTKSNYSSLWMLKNSLQGFTQYFSGADLNSTHSCFLNA